MPVIVKIVSRIDGVPTSVDGQWLQRYDPQLVNGEYLLQATPFRRLARRFKNAGEALEYVRRPCPNLPEDNPGHINRPDRRYHLKIEAA